MSNYEIIARYDEASGVEGLEVAEQVNSHLKDTEFQFIDVVYGGVFLAKESDDGNLQVLGDLQEWEDGDVDYFAETDGVAESIEDSRYCIISFLDGTDGRMLAYSEDENL